MKKIREWERIEQIETRMRIVMKNNIKQTVKKSWFKIDTPWKSVEMWLIKYIFPTPAAIKIFRNYFCTMWLIETDWNLLYIQRL